MIVLRNAAVISIVCVLSQTSIAATILVPTDLPTIQAAVDSAQTGDTVLVAYGRYVEEVLIQDKQIYLIGAGSDSSVIDGTGSDTACILISGVDARSTLIRGFTIEGAIRNARGGIFISDSASAVIEYCCFTDIEADEGGGIFVIDSWDTTYVRYNRFHGIKNPRRGAAVSGIQASLAIIGNLIYDNGSLGPTSAWEASAAISIHRCSTEIRSNTIVNNNFIGAAIYSLRIHLEGPVPKTTIVDNVIANNSTNNDRGYGITLINNQDYSIQYNDIWDHARGSINCVGCVATLDSTNIESDPLVGPPDYLPQIGSPVIGTGSGGGTMGILAAVVECGGPTSICSNGIHENGEECDDGNNIPGDECDAQCVCESPGGDVNADGAVTSGDIIYMVNFVFLAGGPPPQPCDGVGDVNCSGTNTSADIIYLVNYVFKGDIPPCEPCPVIAGAAGCP